MRAARFVTLCFVYSGAILLAQYAIVYRYSLGLEGLAQLGTGLCILAVGLFRLRDPQKEAQTPAQYGYFAYGMAALSLFLTVIFLGQLFVL